jgi:hypothetical protein
MLVALFPLADSDIWWQLASGRELLFQKQFLWTEPFTFTGVGLAWTNVHWLYQLLVYSIEAMAGRYGAGALVVTHALVWGGAAWAWTKPRSGSMTGWLLLLLPLVWANRFLLMARPLAFTMLLLGLQHRLYLSKMHLGKKWGLILFLQIILVNIQGLFLLGPILFVLHELSIRKHWRALVPGALGLLTVSCVHPKGVSILLYPFGLLERLQPGNLFGERISENISPGRAFFGGDPAQLWQAMALVLVTILLFWYACKHTPFRPGLVLLLPLLVLAWLAQRNIPILLLVSLPLLAPLIAKGLSWRFATRAGAAMILAVGIAQVQWWQIYPGAVAPYRFPQGSVTWIQEHVRYRPLRVFCDIRHGGFLSWHLYPQVKTYVDGRLILRDSTFFAQYLNLENHPETFSALDRAWHFDAVVLPVDYPPMFRKLARQLAQDSTWVLVQSDESSWLFMRSQVVRSPLEL